MSNDASTAAANNRHPSALYFIFWGEFAERCCYYGMRAILTLYMTKYLLIPQEDASSYYNLFKMACYLLPLLGGFVADRYLGKYWTIVFFSIPYVIGQSLLAYGDRNMLIFALGLLAFGSGVIKPNISSLLGMTYDQKRPGNINLRGAAFLWFYFAINVGALLSMFALPLIRDGIQGVQPKEVATQTAEQKQKMGLAYQVAFSIPAVLMVGALIAFAAGKKHYATEVPGQVHEQTPEEKKQQWKVLVSLLGVFSLYVLFWLPYEHNDTQWVLFADKYMDLSTPWLSAMGGPDKLSADAYQWINSLGVLILIPFFSFLWPRIDPTGRRFSPIQKISWGLVFTASAPLLMAFCAYMAQNGMHVSCLWLVPAYFLLTIGEVLTYGTGLDFSYAQAPPSMKSSITACFLLSNAISNLINSYWTRFYDNPKSTLNVSPFMFFSIDMALPLLGAVLVLIIGRRFHLSHIKGN